MISCQVATVSSLLGPIIHHQPFSCQFSYQRFQDLMLETLGGYQHQVTLPAGLSLNSSNNFDKCRLAGWSSLYLGLNNLIFSSGICGELKSRRFEGFKTVLSFGNFPVTSEQILGYFPLFLLLMDESSLFCVFRELSKTEARL